MVIAIDPKGERTHITPGDLELPEDQQVEWILRDATERERRKFVNLMVIASQQADNEEFCNLADRVYEVCKFGLAGYTEDKPLRDSKGEIVPFEKQRGQVTDDFLNRLPFSEKLAIHTEIMLGMSLSGEDTEKSEP